MPEKVDIVILHQLARSGGTLISRCLASMDKVNLLSEIHPCGSPEPGLLQQAHLWFGLLNEQEMTSVPLKNQQDFSQAVALLAERAAQQKKQLVIRNWSHLDYIGLPFLAQPLMRPSLRLALQPIARLREAVTVRHPIYQWLSMQRLVILQGKLNLADYLRGYLRFLEDNKGLPVMRYEDFCQQPEKNMQVFCTAAGLDYDAAFIQKWAAYEQITGDSASGAGQRENILPVKAAPVPADLLQAFANQPDYHSILKLLGYRHPVT